MVKVRDLSKSRDNWKQRAGAAEHELRQIKKAKSNQPFKNAMTIV